MIRGIGRNERAPSLFIRFGQDVFSFESLTSVLEVIFFSFLDQFIKIAEVSIGFDSSFMIEFGKLTVSFLLHQLV